MYKKMTSNINQVKVYLQKMGIKLDTNYPIDHWIERHHQLSGIKH